jgi:membrane fusion protein (multidrug efflux system)
VVQDRVCLYKSVDGKTHATPVTVTRVNGGQEYIVESGLKPGDVVLAEGVGTMRDDTPIKAKGAQPQQTPAAAADTTAAK